MIHFVATDGIESLNDECPNIQPTHRLTCGILLDVAARLDLKFEEIAILISQEALEAIRDDEIFREMSGHLFVPMCRKNRRYDWINGEWIERDYNSIEHDFAPFEDAVIASQREKKEFGLIRYRRVVTLESLEFCEYEK